MELKLDRLIDEMRFLKSRTIAFDTHLRGIEAYLKPNEPSEQQPESKPTPWFARRCQLRRQRWTGKQIAAETGVRPARVSRVLRRLGPNKLSALEPAEPVRRYEREKLGELIHLDIKKLGRIGISRRGQSPPRHRLGVCPCLHR
jgi:hypothetical protein